MVARDMRQSPLLGRWKWIKKDLFLKLAEYEKNMSFYFTNFALGTL